MLENLCHSSRIRDKGWERDCSTLLLGFLYLLLVQATAGIGVDQKDHGSDPELQVLNSYLPYFCLLYSVVQS